MLPSHGEEGFVAETTARGRHPESVVPARLPEPLLPKHGLEDVGFTARDHIALLWPM